MNLFLRDCEGKEQLRTMLFMGCRKEETMEHIKTFLQEEDGVGVVEIILILVVLISLVLIFKEQLTSIVNTIFSKITSQSNSI